MNPSISQLDIVIADYLVAVESGDETDLNTLCDRHPEHADGIRDYFAVRANVLHAIGVDDSAAAIQIEGYDILREIGRGATGVVFEAVQNQLHRQVAIKVLRDGALGSAATKQRFEDEAKLIAQLDHENIVGVIDYGVVNGQPYMVMPLARGKALHKMIQKGPLPHSDVARLMLQTTSAVSAAHQQGIIHRDIKPANILADANLQSCLIADFGLAAWNEQTRQLTQTGDIIGTAGYIAPEIIRGKSTGDAKSDVYSIGATMYALLTGVPPFRAATPAESILLAMNSDPVPPRSLNGTIPVDLESICRKCMHPAVEKRYDSAGEVHADLQRFADGKSVVARPVSSWESMARWAKRNRGLAATLAATGMLLLSLLAAISVLFVGYYRYSNELDGINTDLLDSNNRLEIARDDESAARLRAEEQRELTEHVRAYVANIFNAANPIEQGKDIRVVDAIDDAVDRLDADYPDDSEFKSEMLIVFADNYYHLSDHAKADVAYSRAIEMRKNLQLMADVRHNIYRTRYAANLLQLDRNKLPLAISEFESVLDTTDASAPNRRRIYAHLAYAHYLLNQPETAREYSQLAVEGVDFESGDIEENADYLLTHIMTMHEVNPAEANKLYLRFQDQFEDDSIKPIWRVLFHLNFGTLLHQLADYKQAAAVLQLAVDEGQTKLGADDTYVVSAMGTLGSSLLRLNRAKEALPILESAFETRRARYGDQSPWTWITMRNLSQAYNQTGNADKAISMVQRFIQVAEEKGDTSSEDYISLLQELSVSLNGVGRVLESLPILQKIDKYCVEHYEPDSIRTLINKNNLATALSNLGRINESVEIREKLTEAMRSKLTTSHPNTRSAIQNLAVSYWAAAKQDLAMELIDEVIELRKEHDGPESPSTIGAIQEKSKYLIATGKADQALSELQGLQGTLDANFDPADPRVLWNQVRIAEALKKKGQLEKALEVFQNIIDPFTDTKGPDHQETLHVNAEIGDCLQLLNRLDEAEAIFTSAIQTLIARKGRSSIQVLSMQSKLASVFARQEKYDRAEELLDLLHEKKPLNQQIESGVLETRLLIAVALNKQKEFARADRQFHAIIAGYRELKNPAYVLTISLGRSVNLIEAKNGKLAEQVLLECRSLAKPGSYNDLRGQLLLAMARYMQAPETDRASNIREAFNALEQLQSEFLIQHKRRFDEDKTRLLDILQLDSLDELEIWFKAD